MRRRIIVILVLALAIGGGAWWWFNRDDAANGALVLYGNVDLRQVDLAFTDSGRIADVLVEEGDVVAKLAGVGEDVHGCSGKRAGEPSKRRRAAGPRVGAARRRSRIEHGASVSRRESRVARRASHRGCDPGIMRTARPPIRPTHAST